MMIVAAARELAEQRVCFVGVGLPNIAVNLAKRTVAPDLELVYEAGVFGARPARLPLSIGDPTIVTGATAVVSMLELFGYYLQRGLIDVGFLGAAQIDRFGNINTTVIGPYDHPTTRLPGSGGACEIAINARQVFVIMRQTARSFVERIDFRTSPGNLGGAEQAERIRREGGWLGRGPTVVVTDLGIYHFDEAGEMRLDSLHPGATVEAVRDTIGWDVAIAAELAATPAPSDARAAPDPRGARPGRRLHEIVAAGAGSALREVDQELERAGVGDRDDEAADVGRRDRVVRQREGERPRDRIVPLTSCAFAGIDTDLVTPWSVRSPVRVTSEGVPLIAAAGTSTGAVRVNVAVGKLSVWRPWWRMRLSRCGLSEADRGRVDRQRARGQRRRVTRGLDGDRAGDLVGPTDRIALGRQVGQLLADAVAGDAVGGDGPCARTDPARRRCRCW